MEQSVVMPAKAGIQTGFPEALDPRIRGDDHTAVRDSI